MARIPYPDPATQEPELREKLHKLGALNVTRMMSHNQPLMRAFSRMGTTLLLKGELDPVLREAVILRIGQLCGSEYEWHQHVSVARAVGMSEETLAAIEQQAFERLEPRQRLAIRVAEEIHRDHSACEPTIAEAASEFPPAALVELCLLAGYYIMTAGYLRSLAIEIEDTPPLGASLGTGAGPRGG